jgi:hypothetical protein
MKNIGATLGRIRDLIMIMFEKYKTACKKALAGDPSEIEHLLADGFTVKNVVSGNSADRELCLKYFGVSAVEEAELIYENDDVLVLSCLEKGPSVNISSLDVFTISGGQFLSCITSMNHKQ